LSGNNARVLIEVWDADPQPPAKDLGEDSTPDPQEEGGRVVPSSGWWLGLVPHRGQPASVWCELSAEPPELSGNTPDQLAGITAAEGTAWQQKQPIEVRDPDILRRLQDRRRDGPCRTPQQRRPASAGSVYAGDRDTGTPLGWI
jgi:hypothetical protein